jgi:hypothetical protein
MAVPAVLAAVAQMSHQAAGLETPRQQAQAKEIMAAREITQAHIMVVVGVVARAVLVEMAQILPEELLVLEQHLLSLVLLILTRRVVLEERPLLVLLQMEQTVLLIPVMVGMEVLRPLQYLLAAQAALAS